MDSEQNFVEDELEQEACTSPTRSSWNRDLAESEDDWAVRNGIERRSSLDRRLGEDRRIGDRRGLGSSIDPMNIYLQEMGNQRLLTHEEEIELARMIEDGETRIQSAVRITSYNVCYTKLLRYSSDQP